MIPHDYKILPDVGHDTGKVYQDIGVDGFMFHVAHFELTPPKPDKDKKKKK